MRFNAIIVLTAFIQRFLITYRFSFPLEMDNVVSWAIEISQGCLSASVADKRLLERKFFTVRKVSYQQT